MKCLLLALCLVFLMPSDVVARQEEGDDDILSNQALFESGIEFGQFLGSAERRKDAWTGNFEKGSVPPEFIDRVEALDGVFYLLAVAVDGCSDSVNTIPYLALLANSAPKLHMRIISPEAGRHIMEAHRTPDGRPSTPTVLILDSNFEEIGVFIERPAALQDWALGEGKKLGSTEFMNAKFAWYDEDLGRQTMDEVLNIMETNRNE